MRFHLHVLKISPLKTTLAERVVTRKVLFYNEMLFINITRLIVTWTQPRASYLRPTVLLYLFHNGYGRRCFIPRVITDVCLKRYYLQITAFRVSNYHVFMSHVFIFVSLYSSHLV